MRILLFVFVLIAMASVVQADPLTFSNVSALQNGGNTAIDLFANPGTTLTGSQLSFTINIAGSLPLNGTDTLAVSYHDSLGGSVAQQLDIPLFGTVNPPFTLLVTINVPTLSVVAIPATLTVDLVNSNPDFVIPSTQMTVNSFTYSFNVAQPVPEPTTLTLFTGAGAAWLLRNRRIKQKRPSARSVTNLIQRL